MDEQPLVSVLIPVYNVEQFVEVAVRSIINQTYKNIEILIVDDCSTDRTLEIIQRLALEDSRIRIFKNEINSRIVKTLNLAINQAQGDYFARMDGDDISLPTRIEKQIIFLLNNMEISLVGLNVIMIDEQGKEIHKERYLKESEDIKLASEFVSPIPHFWVAKRGLYDVLGLYRIPYAEDLDFILRGIDAGYKMANHPEFLYLQRMRDGNTATASGLVQRKSINYVRKLHQERRSLKTSIDSHSNERLSNAIKINSFEKFVFRVSAFFHFKYIQNKKRNVVLARSYRVMSIAIYPKYQFQEIYNRFRYKRLIKKAL